MKKLIFVFFTLFIFSNELFAESYTCKKISPRYTTEQGSNCSALRRSGWKQLNNIDWPCILAYPGFSTQTYTSSVPCNLTRYTIPESEAPNTLCFIDYELNVNCNGNPQPNSDKQRCDDGFIKDGQFYNCNPNTNEAHPVENSDGYEEDEDGDFIPKCSAGYSLHNQQSFSSPGSYAPIRNEMYCVKTSNDEPDAWLGQTPKDTTSSTGSYTSNSDGSVSWTGTNGNSYNYTPNTGVLIESNFSQGRVEAHTVPNGWQPGQSFTPNGQGYSGSGSSGNGGNGSSGDGGNSGTGDGSGDGNTGDNNNGTDEPVDDTPAATSCTDPNMTLQEKMLCEMNAGMKKLNSESNPSNSMNQLMKDLNHKSTEHNSSLDTLKANTNTTNSKLDSTNTKLETLNTTNKATNTKLDTLSTNTSSTNTKLDSLNTATNSTNTKLDSLKTATDSVKNATTSNTGVLMDIDNKLGKGDEYNSDLEKLKGDSESSNNDFINFYNSMKDSYTALNNQIEGYQSIFENGFKFKPINNSVDNSSIKQCLTITAFGKPVVLDWITPINYIKPITTILLQFFIFLEVGKMFYRVINYTRSVF